MAKDPAFLFYSDNFQSGTQFFTDEQTGKYIRLLCAQHLHGHLTESQMLFICKSYDKDIFKKFAKDADGLYFNERLELEVLKRRGFVESRSTNRKSKNKPKNISSTYEKHMGNGDGNGIGDENVLKKEKRKTDFLADENWKAQFCMAKNLQPDELKTIMAEFISDCDLKGEHVDSYKRYFTNWYNKKIINGSAKTIPITAGGGAKKGTSAARTERAATWNIG